MITINTNHDVKVQLTDHGLKILKEWKDKTGEQVPPLRSRAALRGNPPRWTSFPLWKLMEIFGPHLYNGNPKMPFKDNKIKVAITD